MAEICARSSPLTLSLFHPCGWVAKQLNNGRIHNMKQVQLKTIKCIHTCAEDPRDLLLLDDKDVGLPVTEPSGALRMLYALNRFEHVTEQKRRERANL